LGEGEAEEDAGAELSIDDGEGCKATLVRVGVELLPTAAELGAIRDGAALETLPDVGDEVSDGG